MKSDNNELKELSIRSLFDSPDRYLIPVYQRNYEWQEKQIVQLVDDIRDYYLEERDKQYYIGTLVVDRRKDAAGNCYETIDGQQRLTTFNLVIAALLHLGDSESDAGRAPAIKLPATSRNISFESRPNSDRTLEHVFRNGVSGSGTENMNGNILQGVTILHKRLTRLRAELANPTGANFAGFVEYLFDKVTIVRVQVPDDTELNHYFEIMNSRGEQLEKHEILKSQLMEKLPQDAGSDTLRKQFNQVWEACSDMNRYVQLQFPKELRDSLFGSTWSEFLPIDAADLFRRLRRPSEDPAASNGFSISEILNPTAELIKVLQERPVDDSASNDSGVLQFQPIINFENFLLHVLKIQTGSRIVKLDDKRLVSFFETVMEDRVDKAQFVKDFCYCLLKMRFLLDQFVIKRRYEGGKSDWSLQMLRYYPKTTDRSQDSFSYVDTFGKDEEILLQLLSMFHVSTPTLIYKYWLYAALRYLYLVPPAISMAEGTSDQGKFDGEAYRIFLEQTAKDFLRFRYLNRAGEMDFESLIEDDLADAAWNFDEDLLSYQTIRNNLVFNYIDLLYWKSAENHQKDFHFSFRSSVEHYFPQHPITGEPLGDEALLHSIGNLCLISHGDNSRISNHLPKSKTDFYEKAKSKDSIKQTVMMSICNTKGWDEASIREHGADVIKRLKASLEEQ